LIKVALTGKQNELSNSSWNLNISVLEAPNGYKGDSRNKGYEYAEKVGCLEKTIKKNDLYT